MGERLLSIFVGAVRAVSLLACLVVALSFVLFATGQAGTASTAQANLIALPGQAKPGVIKKPSSARHWIDQTAGKITQPFHSVTGSSSQWVVQIVQTLLVLALYGFGVGYLVRFVRLRAT